MLYSSTGFLGRDWKFGIGNDFCEKNLFIKILLFCLPFIVCLLSIVFLASFWKKCDPSAHFESFDDMIVNHEIG